MEDYDRNDRRELMREMEVRGLEHTQEDAAREVQELRAEFQLLLGITYEITGIQPGLQRARVAAKYKQYADQGRYPDVRDVVKNILATTAE